MNRQEKARWLSEIYAAVAEGKRLQVQVLPHGWRNADPTDGYPDMSSNPDNWRIKPEPKEIVRVVGESFDLRTVAPDCELGHRHPRPCGGGA